MPPIRSFEDVLAILGLLLVFIGVPVFVFMMLAGLACTADNHIDPYNPHRKPDSTCVWLGMSK